MILTVLDLEVLGSSDKESTEKGRKSVKRTLEDPRWVGGGVLENIT
jgi:hypothetical protein